jgi:hypothetical protein
LNRKTFGICIAMLAFCAIAQLPAQAREPARHSAEKPRVAHKKHNKRKPAARRADVMYRWSAKELMLGGVDPASIGKDASGK